jgi:hypothetical protein
VTNARRGLACGILALSLLASCATPGPSGDPRVLALDDEGLRVSVPADWEAMRSGDVGFASGRVLFYVSNRALQADCGQEGGEQDCTLPVRALDDGGVLLLWATSACAGVVCNLPDGDRRLISGREAAAAPRTGMCEPIGATEEEVYAVTVTPQRVDWIVICARSPGDEERADLASILDGVDWRTP